MRRLKRRAGNVSADMVCGENGKGYDSDVGESGGLLSTGEKQLISFARAVLANPAIFSFWTRPPPPLIPRRKN